MDGIEVFRFVFPESDLDQWVGMALFEGLFWLEFQNIFDLFGPHDDTTFEDMGFIFLRNVVSRG